MTSYGSSGGVEFALNKRHMPRSQVEAVPIDDVDISDDDSSSINPSSLRANFLPPNLDLPALDPTTIDRYGSLHDSSPFFSPVFAHLPSIRPDKLHVASEDAQTLRRKLMRDSNILIIQGGYSGKTFIYERLRDLGVNLYILDGPDSVWKKAAEDGLIVDFIELDFTDNDTIFPRAMDAIVDAGLDVQFDAVTTYYEDAVALAARIGTAMGLTVNDVEACDRARNKRRTREVMAVAGLPVPLFQKVLGEEDIPRACEHVGFPLILKPVYGAASMGVTKAHSTEEAVGAYRKLFKTFDVKEDTIWAQGTEMVIEEFYDGDEFDIDILLSDGIAVYAKVSDNWACCDPWFQETGTNCPSLYPQDKQNELIKLAVDSTLSLGFKYGSFHVECKYTSRGPRMIEVNARMGGVSVRDANLIAWGVDLVEEHAMAMLKIPIRPLFEKPLKYFAESAINAPYSGTINTDNWLDFALENPLVHKISYFKHKGDVVVGPKDSVPDWMAEIIVVSEENQEEAIKLIRSVMKKAEVPITAKEFETERAFFFPDYAHPFC
ncbi:unnamed protein product [Chondrus crispus]|uniref:ATP-grasp domain-containing protein n=1 Tax=Chondrus crispus TaxID=2769 RepID=R7QGZ7_CHOCR|nr:unnamed protein product [Chondrus crispus]CDF36998.1 unnamed protein product [Chondrus crispus]|eukprot:XP_005716817.1 unnamed protein product [Chondrus crispus]